MISCIVATNIIASWPPERRLTGTLHAYANTQYIIKRAYSRIWILKRLYNLGASQSQMLDVYIKQIRSVLELAVPAWHPSLTLEEKIIIERVQKTALHIIYLSWFLPVLSRTSRFENGPINYLTKLLNNKFKQE